MGPSPVIASSELVSAEFCVKRTADVQPSGSSAAALGTWLEGKVTRVVLKGDGNLGLQRVRKMLNFPTTDLGFGSRRAE